MWAIQSVTATQLCPCDAKANVGAGRRFSKTSLTETGPRDGFGLWALVCQLLLQSRPLTSLPLLEASASSGGLRPLHIVASPPADDTCSYVDSGFFPADARGLLCEVSQGPRGRLLLPGAGIRADAEADIQCQPSLLLPVHNFRHCAL